MDEIMWIRRLPLDPLRSESMAAWYLLPGSEITRQTVRRMATKTTGTTTAAASCPDFKVFSPAVLAA
jgi:hypothetical protein